MYGKLAFGLLIVVGLGATPATGGDDRDLKEVQAASRRYLDALKNGHDPKTLDNLFADNFVMVWHHGGKANKKKAIEAICDPFFVVKSFQVRQLEIRLFGQTAVETGRREVELTRVGVQTIGSHSTYTLVWVKIGGQWKVVSEHQGNAPVDE